MKGRAVRFRRLDRHNFVIERLCDGTSGRWTIEGYYTTLESMVRAGLDLGIDGEDLKALRDSLAEAETRVLAALHEAIQAGSLS